MTHAPFTEESVLRFLQQFEELAASKDFDLIEDMVHENAFFRFNDGDFRGRAAVRAAFEKTWRGSASVRKERFCLSDVVVLTVDNSSAAATYTYHWEGSMEGQAFQIRGRGTRVLVREQGRVRIIHEHLSRFPRQP